METLKITFEIDTFNNMKRSEIISAFCLKGVRNLEIKKIKRLDEV